MPNYECVYDKDSASITIESNYREKSNFRSVCFYTANLIRSSTKKNLVFLHSGGADSTAFSYVFRNQNIDIKRVHIRYFFKGKLINSYESNNIYEDDVTVYDVDVEEFERSDQHRSINEKVPFHVFLTLQTYYPDLDPENDLLIRGASTLPIRKQDGEALFVLPVGSTLLPLLYPCECIDFIQHNPVMLCSAFTDPFIERQVNSMGVGEVYSKHHKEELYKHYFPEIPKEHLLQKTRIAFWEGFNHLHINTDKGIYYNYDGTIVDSYPQRTYWKYNYKELIGYMKKNKSVTLRVRWNYDGDYHTIPQQEVFIK